MRHLPTLLLSLGLLAAGCPPSGDGEQGPPGEPGAEGERGELRPVTCCE